MKRFRVLFMGTPDFAVPCLVRLVNIADVIGVVTQPDKPKGRGQRLLPPPVKFFAVEHGLPIYQPIRVKTALTVMHLNEYRWEIERTCAGFDCCCCFWANFVKGNLIYSTFGMYQCPCITFASLSRGSTDSVGHRPW